MGNPTKPTCDWCESHAGVWHAVFSLEFEDGKCALGWTDCFEEKDLDAHGLLRPGERVGLLQKRALLYGPAINVSSYATVALTYARVMTVVCGHYNYYVPYPSTPQQAITVASDFNGESVFCLILVTPRYMHLL